MVSQKFELLKHPTTNHGYTWQPGVWVRLPWLGLLALTGALLCACAAAVVLHVCDGDPIDKWRLQPTVYLAILSALTNAFLRFAFAEGATISWWTKTLHTSSIRNLHYNWSYGNNLWSILTSRRPFNIIRLAGFFVTFVVIDGPLLQRASVSVSSVKESSISLMVPISPGPFVGGATGILTYGGDRPAFFTSQFGRIVLDQGKQSNISLSPTDCKGSCDTEILAAGFDVSCEMGHTATTLPLDDPYGRVLHDPAYENSTIFDVVDLNSTVFSIAVKFIGGSSEVEGITPTPAHIAVTVLFKEQPAIDSGLSNHTCIFREAITQYPIRISNDTVSLRYGEIQAIHGEGNVTQQLVGRPTELGASAGIVDSTLGGMYLALLDQFNTTTIVRMNLAKYQYYNDGSAGRRYFNYEEVITNGNMIWRDPMPDIITSLWDLSFRTAVESSREEVPDIDMESYPLGQPSNGYGTFIKNQTVEARHREVVIVFNSNYSYLGGALAVMLLSTFTIIPTFYGWWLHGRDMSLSPIEIAKAFNAPYFQEVSSNATADQMLDILSQREVCYGIRRDEELMKRVKSEPSISSLAAAEGNPTAQSGTDGDHAFDSGHADHNRDRGGAEEHFLPPSSRSQGKAAFVHAYQEQLYDDENATGHSMRLEIMDALHARKPRKGEIYI